ncbi:PfkB family carbohydrate kinase [Schlesneria sp.]|uniref:PfkB family carbohydrate kinase n=1 Tax=Schlesneria sp. TaxID=2762018 RepID=UPI002F236620
MNKDPRTIFDQIGYPKILVLGDLILDRYTWGNAERVSPEAPVLVLNVESHEVRLGGAASVAHLLRALEADVTLAGLIGNDANGRVVRRLIDEVGIESRLVVCDPGRPTTTKERFIGRAEGKHPHQVLRVDEESCGPLSADFTSQFLNGLADQIPQHTAVLISDYAKGVCTKELITEVIRLCRKSNIPVLVDPGRGTDFENYRGATLIKPNRFEAELATGRSIRTPASAICAAEQLRKQYDIEIAVITLDREGLVYATASENEHHPITAIEICDITGAGDTVLAILGLTISSRFTGRSNTTLRRIAALANSAAGLQVGKSGVIPISRADLLREAQKNCPVDPSARNPQARSIPNLRQTSNAKLISIQQAKRLADQHRREGRTVVFTNGCFDLLHVGHVAMLTEAAKLGDVLIVAINSDASVRRLKGMTRPIIAQRERAEMLAALACVDHVLIFDDDTPHRLLEGIRPDVLVKGGTTPDIVGREIVERYGGRIERTSEIPGLSTTIVLSRLQSTQSIPVEEPI